MFLEVEEGGQDRDEEAVKVYLIRFIADLPLTLLSVYFSVFTTLHYIPCKLRMLSNQYFSVRLYFKLVCAKWGSVLEA